MTEEAPKVGRPTKYTKELADHICSELSEGKSLRTVCFGDDMPCKATIFNWLRTHEEFLDQYARAKQESADAIVEEILDIADDGSNDYMTITRGDNEYNVENREVTSRSKIRIDARKWISSKLKPKKYGDKLDLTSKGKEIKAPVIISDIPSRNVKDKTEAAEGS